MEILTRDQLNKLIDLYESRDTFETFLPKVINKFPLTEDEIHLAFQIIDRCFIKFF